MARKALEAQAAAWRVAPAPEQTDALLRYVDLLLTWSARINLTGARSPAEVVTDHLVDAFALAEALDRPEQVADVGSGGGLPAIPLALLRPTLRVLLCEPLAKKGAFLRTAIRELGLGARVQLRAGRGEDLAAERPGDFDVAISRATFAPEDWLPLGRRLVRAGGRVCVLTTPASGFGATVENEPKLYAGGRRALFMISR